MRILIIILITFLTACYSNKDNNTKEISKTPTSFISYNVQDSGIVEIDFDIYEYKVGFDSLLFYIIGKRTQTSLLIDTLTGDDVIFYELRNTPLSGIVKEACLSVKSSFFLPKGNSRLKHHIIILAFTNAAKADSIFTLLNKIALEKSGVPGLTYTNDYLVQVENEIFWINSNCSYSYANHLRFVKVFNKMINIIDRMAIECKCGKVKCFNSIE